MSRESTDKLAGVAIVALALISVFALIAGVIVATVGQTPGSIVAVVTGAVGGIVAIGLQILRRENGGGE